MSIYLDNGATSFPKPKSVELAIVRALTEFQGSASRSNSKEIHTLERLVYDTRLSLAQLFKFDYPDHIIFTKNVTESINLFLLGYLKKGNRVVLSSLEHNAVVRPLEALKMKLDISLTIISCDDKGQMNLDELEAALKEAPHLLVVNHASNVSGDIQNLDAIGKLANKYQIPFLVDAAQSAGVLPIDMKVNHIDVLAFTGHKALLGPQGIGGLAISPKLAKEVTPLIYGGTGSYSEHFEQPSIMPDKFESGTPNSLGILGLKAGIDTINQLDFAEIHRKESALIEMLQMSFYGDETVQVIGNPDPAKRVGILSVNFLEKDNAIIAHQLSKEFDIITRVGLHCAPLAHKSYKTYPHGTVRFSTSIFTTEDEIKKTIEALKSLKDR